MNLLTKQFDDDIYKLKKFIPIVSKVHGIDHPEIKEVEKEFNKIIKKINSNLNDINVELKNITRITNDFIVPEGVCESYKAVYIILKNITNTYVRYIQ